MNSTDLERFESHRPLMFSIAYRMLGSVTEAEDMLQEAFLRYQNSSRNEIISVKAFLSAIVTRLCINRLGSAQKQREMYIGTWLPEPILTNQEESVDTVRHVELHESLSMAFLVLLEQLTPLERAVFLLRQVLITNMMKLQQSSKKTKWPVANSSAALKNTFRKIAPAFSQILSYIVKCWNNSSQQ